MPQPFDSAMRAALAGMFAMATVMGIGRFVYTPILPLMMGAGTGPAALDASQAGLVAGFNYLGYLVGALGASAGFFAPHRRIWLFLALAASVVTTAAAGLTVALSVLILIRFLSGVASAFGMIFITSLVTDKLAEEGRPGLIALHFAGVGVGIAASAVIVSVCAASDVAWTTIWLASGLVSALAIVAVAWLLPATTREARPQRRRKGEPSNVGAPLVIYILSYGFFGFGYVITATFINAMAKSEPALAPVEPFVWVVFGLSLIPSVWFWNRVVRLAGLTGGYAIACLVAAAGVGVSVTIVTPVALLVSSACVGGTMAGVTALGFARTRIMGGASPAAIIALMTASFGVGQVIGPVIAGWLFDWKGNLFLASWLATAALVAAALLALMGEKIGKRTAN